MHIDASQGGEDPAALPLRQDEPADEVRITLFVATSPPEALDWGRVRMYFGID